MPSGSIRFAFFNLVGSVSDAVQHLRYSIWLHRKPLYQLVLRTSPLRDAGKALDEPVRGRDDSNRKGCFASVAEG